MIEIKAEAKRGIANINYFINGGLWYSGSQNETLVNKVLPPLKKGYHSIMVRVCDDVNNCSESSVDINLKNKTSETLLKSSV